MNFSTQKKEKIREKRLTWCIQLFISVIFFFLCQEGSKGLWISPVSVVLSGWESLTLPEWGISSSQVNYYCKPDSLFYISYCPLFHLKKTSQWRMSKLLYADYLILTIEFINRNISLPKMVNHHQIKSKDLHFTYFCVCGALLQMQHYNINKVFKGSILSIIVTS